MFEVLLKTLGTALSIWEHAEKNKYIEAHMRLERDYYEEINKPDDRRSGAVLDNLEHELRVLSIAFSAAASKSNA